MIAALLIVGILGMFVGVYLGIAGMALFISERHGAMRKTIARQAYELLDVRKDARMWQVRALKAEHLLPVHAVAQILREEVPS